MTQTKVNTVKHSPLLTQLSGAPAAPSAQPARQGDAKERILAAAHLCFERFGVAKTTMDDVAQVAAYSRKTVYKHFPSKADLLTAVGIQESQKLNDEIRRRVSRKHSQAARIAESVIAALQYARENAYIRKLIEPQDLRSRVTDRNDPIFAMQRDRWAPLLKEGQASGELATDLNIDEVVIWLSLAQMALLVQFEQPGQDAELEHMVRRFVVAPLLSKPST